VLYTAEFGFQLDMRTEMALSCPYVFKDMLDFNMYTYFLLVAYVCT
jgi:hypothetical protein